MKLSTRTRYGTRAMAELAAAYGDGPVPVHKLAARQNLSEKYLEQIMVPLKAAGLVEAVRGPGGGYVLARPPSHIRLTDIFRVFEGSTALVDCIDDPEICPLHGGCPTRPFWGELKVAIEGILGRTTLQDLLNRWEKHEHNTMPMYHI